MRVYAKRCAKWTIGFALSYFLIYISYIVSFNEKRSFVTYFNTESGLDTRQPKFILIWTPFISDDIKESFEKCQVGCLHSCMFTTNKSEIRKAHAVIFNNYNLFPKWKIGTKSIIPLPTYRQPDQTWVLFNMEPPGLMYWDLNLLNGIFNLTAWYRTDANIWLPYGSGVHLNISERYSARKQFGQRNFYKEKTREISGMISNCLHQGQRYKLVYQLQKYLDIDMYGKCYDKTCESVMKTENKTCDDILAQYKFYLAFENSNCKDYVTEKYWNALNRNQIPIVNWKNINENMFIPMSYINVYDFDDVRSFVKYVKAVSLNETLYNSYFQWKSKYKIKDSCVSCELCHKLHSNVQRQVYSDLSGWIMDDICPKLTDFNNMFGNFRQFLWTYGIDI